MTDAEWDALWASSPTQAQAERAARERQRADTQDLEFRRYAAWVAVDPKGRTCGLRTALTLLEWEERYGGAQQRRTR